MGSTSELVGAGGFWSQQEVFTSSGTFTSNADTTRIRVTVVGGGGGGGIGSEDTGTTPDSLWSGSGGSPGEVLFQRIVPVLVSTGYTVTIGAGGLGKTSNPSTGGDGGSSSIAHDGGTLTAIGGDGGESATASASDSSDTTLQAGATGGISGFLGGAGKASLGVGAAGQANTGSGGGGAGSIGNSGAGGSGIVIVEYENA